jgi:predicted Ser/Thr protein kinase
LGSANTARFRGSAKAHVELSDTALDHLIEVVERPDFSGSRYELGCEIGRGGIGVVYAARDRELERSVAIKIMEPALSGEARLIAQLEHPAIVPVYDSGVLADGRVWYAMKLIAGARLDRWVDEDRSLGERLLILRRVGEALGYAHSCGVPHRDLKPQNVMVGAFGEVYVMDWGVDGVAGTPAFRAPEAQLNERSDIYSLGALLQFLLPPDASPALRAIAVKAMSDDPAARYSDPASLLADLDRFQDGLAVQAWPEPLWHQAWRFAVRNAVLLCLVGAYALVRFFLFFLRGR